VFSWTRLIRNESNDDGIGLTWIFDKEISAPNLLYKAEYRRVNHDKNHWQTVTDNLSTSRNLVTMIIHASDLIGGFDYEVFIDFCIMFHYILVGTFSFDYLVFTSNEGSRLQIL